MRFGHGQAAAILGLAFAVFSGSTAALGLNLDPNLGEAATTRQAPDSATYPALDLTIAAELRDQGISALVVDKALTMLGTTYKFGVDSDDAMDCSALVRRAFLTAGLEMPRSTQEQIRLGVPVAVGKLRKGDLLFYRWNSSMHVALYMDDTHILHASPKEGRVVVTRLTSNWDRHLVVARRVI